MVFKCNRRIDCEYNVKKTDLSDSLNSMYEAAGVISINFKAETVKGLPKEENDPVFQL